MTARIVFVSYQAFWHIATVTPAPNKLLDAEIDRCFRLRVLTMLKYIAPKPGERILDCGTGRGFFVKLLSEESGTNGIGLDLDFKFLLQARKNSSPRLALAQGSADRLPFPDSTFDKVVCSEVLEHLTDDRAALRELRRVLKPGGTLALTVPNSRYPLLWDPINWCIESVFGRPIRTGAFSGIWTNHQRLYKIEELLLLLKEAQFEVTDTEHLTYFCMPFSHNLFYELGPKLISSGLVGKEFDRYAPETLTSPSVASKLLVSLLRTIDTLNSLIPPKRTSVCIALKAIKGGA